MAAPKSLFDQLQALERQHNKRWDAYFAKHYFIFEAPLELDLLGVDRIFVSKIDAVATTVEYKNDSRAAQTGRAYIEDLANTELITLGWVHTCKAERVLICIPPIGRIYVCRAQRLRDEFSGLKEKFGTRKAFNGRYFSTGCCIPLEVLTTLADAVIELNSK
jgi:hypothetical protein